MPKSNTLKQELVSSLQIFKSEKHLVGRLNDKLLAELLQDFRDKRSTDKLITFINCINFFYSTRIQAAPGRKDDNVIKIGNLLLQNWDEGLKLTEIKQGDEMNPTLVETLREEIHILVNRDLYSLSTKIFHQLNSQYPIYDNRVKNFLKVNAEIKKIKLLKNYEVFCNYYVEQMKKIEWPLNQVDEFDSAIWALETK